MTGCDIFISYRRSDAAGHARALHRDLCRRFDRERIFFDRDTIESGEDFPDRLRDGVSQCMALVALIGPDWLDARDKDDKRRLDDPHDFVRHEIALALSQGKKVIPVLFDDTPMTGANTVPDDLTGLARCDALTLRGKTYEYDTQLAELVRILAAVPGMPEPKPLIDDPGKRYLRFAGDLVSNHFSGRDAELAALDKALPLGDATTTHLPVALHGMGGCGKTQLALTFSIDRQDEYAGVWWFRAERTDLLEADFEGFCKDCNIPRDEREAPFAAALRWLARQQRWLLVFDNADAPDELRTYLKPFKEQRELARHHILITSRNPAWASIAIPLEVKAWNIIQGAAFLASRLPDRTDDELMALAERLGGLPLALEQAAAFMDDTCTPVADYLAMLASVDTSTPLLQEGRPATGYERSVVATLSLAAERLSPAAMELMRLCACLAPEPIPISLFKSSYELLPADLQKAAGNPLAWTKTLGELVRFGLATRLKIEVRGTVIGEGLQLHRLTQEVFIALFGQTEDLKAAVQLLGKGLPKDFQDPKAWPEGVVLTSHLLRAASIGNGQNIDAKFLVETMNRAAVLTLHAGMFRTSESLARRSLEMGTTILGGEHPYTLTAMSNMAGALRVQGNLHGARDLQQQVLEARHRILGSEHLDTLTAMGSLAVTLSTQGDLLGARGLQQQVLEARRRILGSEHPDSLKAMGTLATTLADQGDLHSARKLLEQVLEVSLRIFGSEHPYTLTTMGNLATILSSQGDLPGACDLQQQVLEAARRILGREHPNTLTVMGSLAVTLRSQGDLPGARDLQQQVLEARHRILGSEHPDTTQSAWDMFITLLNVHDSDVAREVRRNHLSWLLQTDPNRLAANQTQIRQYLIDMLEPAK